MATWYIQGPSPDWSDTANWTANYNNTGANPAQAPWTALDSLSDNLLPGSTFTGVLNCDVATNGLGATFGGYCNIPTRFTVSIWGGEFIDVAFSVASGATLNSAFFNAAAVTIESGGNLGTCELINCSVTINIGGSMGSIALKSGPVFDGVTSINNAGEIYYATIGNSASYAIPNLINTGTIWFLDSVGPLASSSGTILNARFTNGTGVVTNSGNIGGGQFLGNVNNQSMGVISGGQFSGLYNYGGRVISGQVNTYVQNSGTGSASVETLTLRGGEFSGIVNQGATLVSGSRFVGGLVKGPLTINGSGGQISDGTFLGTVGVFNRAVIMDGIFLSTVTCGAINAISDAYISGGVFLESLINEGRGRISGGIFLGTSISNRATISDGFTIYGLTSYTRLGAGTSAAARPCDVLGSF